MNGPECVALATRANPASPSRRPRNRKTHQRTPGERQKRINKEGDPTSGSAWRLIRTLQATCRSASHPSSKTNLSSQQIGVGLIICFAGEKLNPPSGRDDLGATLIRFRQAEAGIRPLYRIEARNPNRSGMDLELQGQGFDRYSDGRRIGLIDCGLPGTQRVAKQSIEQDDCAAILSRVYDDQSAGNPDPRRFWPIQWCAVDRPRIHRDRGGDRLAVFYRRVLVNEDLNPTDRDRPGGDSKNWSIGGRGHLHLSTCTPQGRAEIVERLDGRRSLVLSSSTRPRSNE